MNETKCAVCQTRLTGGLDTYGDVHLPMCQACWLELEFTPVEPMHVINCATCRNAYDAMLHRKGDMVRG